MTKFTKRLAWLGVIAAVAVSYAQALAHRPPKPDTIVQVLGYEDLVAQRCVGILGLPDKPPVRVLNVRWKGYTNPWPVYRKDYGYTSGGDVSGYTTCDGTYVELKPALYGALTIDLPH